MRGWEEGGPDGPEVTSPGSPEHHSPGVTSGLLETLPVDRGYLARGHDTS